MNKNTDLQPGILSIFQIFALVMFGLLSLRLPGIWRGRLSTDVFNTAVWLQSAFLLVYLYWGWLRRRLGATYLPIALGVAAIVPVVGAALDGYATIRQGALNGLLLGTVRLYFWLLLPLILLAAQYNFRAVLLFSTGTSLLAVLLALPLAAAEPLITVRAIEQAGGRWLLFTVAGLMITRIANAQRDQQRELIAKNAQLAQFAGTLEQLTLSRERNRLARELHDTLAHTLSAVSVQLQAAEVQIERDPAAARTTLAQAQNQTRTGLTEARRALHALRSQPVEELGLTLAIRQLAEQTAAQAGFRLTLALPETAPRLNPNTAQQAYRIAAESLSNIARHAQAHSVALELRQHANEIELLITDDGRGFDPAQAATSGHYGLRGMHERAQLVGGTLVVQAQPGRGATVRLRAPCEGRTA